MRPCASTWYHLNTTLKSESTEISSSKIHLCSLSVQCSQLHKVISILHKVISIYKYNTAFNMVFAPVVLFSNGAQILVRYTHCFHLVLFYFIHKALPQMTLDFSKSQTCLQSRKLYLLGIFKRIGHQLFWHFLTRSSMDTMK